MVARYAVALAVCGCGGGVTGGHPIDATPADAAPDAPGGTTRMCSARPTTPFGTPTKITALSSAQFDGKPSMTADGLDVFFKSGRPDNATVRIFHSSRTSIGGAWSLPAAVTELNSGMFDASPTVSADGLSIWFVSYRTGGPGAGDIYTSTRARRTDPWAKPKVVTELSTMFYEDSITVTPDGLVAYFHSSRNTGSAANSQIFRTSRLSTTSAWSAPTVVTELASTYDDANAWISPDECTLYFDSDRPGGQGQYDLFVATRPVPDARFDKVVPASELNGTFYDADPFLTADQRTIIFATNRPASEFDIYEATR